MADTPNNPAGRLHLFLVKLRRYPDQHKIGDVIAQEAGLRSDDHMKLFRVTGRLMELPPLIQSQIERIEGINRDLFLAWVPTITKAFKSLNLNASTSTIKGHLDDKTLHGIEFCDDALSKHFPDPVPTDDALAPLREKVEELLGSLQSAPLDQRSREYVAEHLEAILDAISLCPIVGSKPLRQAVESALGSSALDARYRSVDESPFKKEFWLILVRVALVLEIAHHVPWLSDKAQAFFQYLQQNEAVIQQIEPPTLPPVESL